jgi:hypothetical protein
MFLGEDEQCHPHQQQAGDIVIGKTHKLTTQPLSQINTSPEQSLVIPNRGHVVLSHPDVNKL